MAKQQTQQQPRSGLLTRLALRAAGLIVILYSLAAVADKFWLPEAGPGIRAQVDGWQLAANDKLRHVAKNTGVKVWR